MTTGIGPLLRSGNIKNYTPMGEEGNPVYKWATQIRVTIKRKINSDSINVFAIPQSNENGDIIDWYAPESGSVIPWSSATREEKISAKEQLTSIQQQLIVVEDEFNQNENNEQSVFKRLLVHVIQFPDDEHVYLVNGKPVLTFWGFVETEANSRPDPLAVLAIPELPKVVESIPVHDNDVEALLTKRKFPWWWLIALLLLLLWLLFFLKGCDKVVEDPILLEFVESTGIDSIFDGKHIDPLNNLSQGIERNTINDGTVVESVNTDKILDNTQLPLEAEDFSETIQEPHPETAESEEITEENKPEADQGREEPLTQEDLPVEPEQNQDPQEQPAETQPAKENPPQQPLAIPNESSQQSSMDFLNGRWQANSGLMDEQGRPVNLEYDFKDGKGNVRIKKNDGTVCSGTVEASRNGAELTFSDKDVIKCPNGKSYQPAKVKCKVDASKQTVCEGAYSSGENFKMDINKSAEAE